MAGSGERGDDVDVGIILLIKLNAFCKSVGLVILKIVIVLKTVLGNPESSENLLLHSKKDPPIVAMAMGIREYWKTAL